MSVHNVNLRVVLSKTKQIIDANLVHFLALSLFFVVPLSFSAVVYPSLSRHTSFVSSYTRLLSSETPPVDIIFTVLISWLFELLLSFFSTACVTHSIVNGFYGEPLVFASSVKSTLVAFLPLTATYAASWLIMGLTLFAVGLAAGCMCGGMFLLWPETDLFPALVISLAVMLMGVMVYCQLEWYLADVIVVVESKWGFAPLRRSSYLVKGMRSVALSISVVYRLLLVILSALFSSIVPTPFHTWFGFTLIATIMRVYKVAATAVLFIYCRGLRGELAMEMADGFALSNNIRLPYDGCEKAQKAGLF